MNNLYNTKIYVVKSINKIFDIIGNIMVGEKFYIIDINIYTIYTKYFDILLNYRNYIIVFNGEFDKCYDFVGYILVFLLKYYSKYLCIISIGGGVCGDISGLVASLFYRGIRLIHVPTTVVSQVDSSIGGKNGVNTVFGKNVIGTIYHPNYILISPRFLLTLSLTNYRLGYSEILKVFIINNPRMFRLLYVNSCMFNYDILYNIIKHSIISKLIIVNKDVYDKTYRLKLNLGHTFAHAIECSSRYKISHGEAVFMGINIILILSVCFYKLLFREYYYILTILKCYYVFDLCAFKFVLLDIIKYIYHDKKIYGNYGKILIIRKLGKVCIDSILLLRIVKFIKFIILVS